jgi:membrane fusion protein (multidrug efflux system)
VQVGTVELALEAVPYVLTLPGRAVAYEEVDVRPRVSGLVEEIAYAPGEAVSRGGLLFRIEDDQYAASAAAAAASLAGAQADVAAAQATAERYRSLEGSAVTRAELELAEATLLQAQASRASAEAALQAARFDLERTEIRSSIDGVPSVPEVSVGDLVTANQPEALTTVTRLDPIFVDVAESSARVLRIRERIDAGSLSPGDTIGLRLVLETGEMYEGQGTLVALGTAVATTTGTMDFRFEFGNPDQMILPGQFLRVDVTLGTSQAVLVPQRATRRASDGALTAFVAKDGVARQVTLVQPALTRTAGW